MSALRHAVVSGRLRRVRRGAYVEAERSDGSAYVDRERVALNDAIGAALTISGGVLSHRSAALWHGLPVLHTDRPCLTVSSTSGHRHPGLHVHRCPVGAEDLLDHVEHPVTTIARTIIDLAREHGLPEAVVAGDAALREHRVSRSQLDAVLAECRGWPGTRAGQDAAGFIDGRSESVLESLSRIAIRQHGLPAPVLQAVIRDQRGEFVARVDFLFEELGVIGEADGLMKYGLAGVEEHEQRRRQRLENLGWGFVRWQSRDLRDFAVIADRIRHTAKHLAPRVTGSWDGVP